MKVGILTFHYATNYGAVLQTYALQNKLKELGHDVYIIDRWPDYTSFVRWLYHQLSYKHRWGWLKFRQFYNKKLSPKTDRYDSMVDFVKGFNDYHFDAVVVGSDQVWRWNWRMVGLNYFLDFIPSGSGVKKIAYAASFGLSEWKDSEGTTNVIKKLLHDFNGVSVREQTGVEICKRVFNIEAQLVLDPTLLYDRYFYENTLLKEKTCYDSGKVVSIMLSRPDQSIEIAQWAKNRGLRHTELAFTAIENPRLFRYSEVHFQHLAVEDWLNEIRNARFVITNSFHATVFCLLFNKRFVVVEHESGGNDRIRTLLSLLNNTISIVKEIAQINDIPATTTLNNIDYFRRLSLRYLEENLR